MSSYKKVWVKTYEFKIMIGLTTKNEVYNITGIPESLLYSFRIFQNTGFLCI